MQVPLTFKDLVKQISVLLNRYGFKKQGNTFYKQQNKNWSLISFQKSVKNTSSEFFFTVNLGVCSHAIREFFDREKVEKKPTFLDSHWQQRLSDFIVNDKEIWWAINENTNLESLAQEIEDLLINHALPRLEQLISDEQLENLWRSKLPNKLDFRHKLNLTVLLKKSGKFDELALILKQLEKETEGKPTEALFKVVRADLLNTN